MDYKLVETSNGREMWYKSGKLVPANKVPEQTKEYLRNPKKVEEANPDDIDVELSGFTDVEIRTDNSMGEKQKRKAELMLKKHFPEFDYNVIFRPKYKTSHGKTVPDRYNIDITRNGQFVKSITSKGFNLPVLKENIEAIFNGWTKREKVSRKPGSVYTKNANMESKNVGTKQIDI